MIVRLLLLMAAAGGAFTAQSSDQTTAQSGGSPAPQAFTIEGGEFRLNGAPFEILSGEMHYARIPRPYWTARIRMAKAMGLNTIATYVFWNVHEPRPGVYDFSGNADLVAFIKAVQAEGMYVILRAGPYACAEWEFGGFPAWLLADERMKTALRSNDAAFMGPVEQWLMRLGHEVAPLQIGRGGPILAVQIENEYGNFGSDKVYLAHLKELFLKAGFDSALLYTTDPTRGLANGSLPGTYAAVNFGVTRAQAGLDELAKLRPGEPLLASEYWPGWFDHWGQQHESRPVEPQLKDLAYMLDRGASFNLYMFHGGTSFGWMAGASWTTNQYMPDVTSYDYDAPLDEAGHPTAKYYAYRNLFQAHSPTPLPPVPKPPVVIAIPKFFLRQSSSLLQNLPPGVPSEQPATMEHYGQSYGLILYRTHLPPVSQAELALQGMNDYALIYINGSLVGTLDRRLKQDRLLLRPSTKPATLDVLVENSGRINSTRMMRQESKGITGATLDGRPLTGWKIIPLPLDDLSTLNYKTRCNQDGPCFERGVFRLETTGDTFLDVRTVGKGAVWINRHALGRVWNIGPQGTLYLPDPWLKKGLNEVVVLDLLPYANTITRLQGLTSPILDTPLSASNEKPDQ